MLNKALLRKLGPDFGYLAEEADNAVEQEILNKLDRSVKLDTVDTITFGLETDDGKIVKVYVNADQADDFEKELSKKLGEVDDIEEALNMLAKDFDIVDVEWPSEEVDSDEESDDGSEVLDPKVYDNDKEKEVKGRDLKPKIESLNFGEKVSLDLMESSNDGTSIEHRFTTATQLLVYHAIIELGIPEIALSRSPYRSAIIKGIKDRSIEFSKNLVVKGALRTFVKRAVDFEERAAKNLARAKIKDSDLNDDVKSEKLALTESVSDVFWDVFVKLVNYVATDQRTAQQFLAAPALKQLMARSSSVITSKVSMSLQTKLKALGDAITTEPKLESLNENASPDEISELFKNLLTMADSSGGSVADTIMKSSAWTTFFNSFKSKLSTRFGTASRSKLSTLQAAMKLSESLTESKNATLNYKYSYGSEKFDAGYRVEVIGDDGDSYLVKPFPIMADKKKALKFKKSDIKLDGSPKTPIGGPGGDMPGGLNESEPPVWTFTKDEDLMVVQCQTLTIKLDDEGLERVVKGITNKDTVIVKDAEDPTHKVAFSPRGSSVLVKKVGTVSGVMLRNKDVSKFLSFVGQEDEDEEDTANDKTSTDEVVDDKATIDAKTDADVKKG